MAKRKKFSTLMLMLDIDNLEWINNQYGKDEGSLLLFTTANILRRTFRQTDVIARFKNNVFAVLALETGKDSDKAIVSRLKKNFNYHNKTSFKTYDISISIGAAFYGHANIDTIDELIKKAGFKMNERKVLKTFNNRSRILEL